MVPIEFEEMNCTYAKNQPEYLPLPAHKTKEGEVISCWKLNNDELETIKKTGKIYLSILTFNCPLQPIILSVLKPEIIKGEKE